MIGESLSEQLAQECIDSAKKFGIQPEIFPATHGDDVDKHFKEHDLKVFKTMTLKYKNKLLLNNKLKKK